MAPSPLAERTVIRSEATYFFGRLSRYCIQEISISFRTRLFSARRILALNLFVIRSSDTFTGDGFSKMKLYFRLGLPLLSQDKCFAMHFQFHCYV